MFYPVWTIIGIRELKTQSFHEIISADYEDIEVWQIFIQIQKIRYYELSIKIINLKI